MRDRQMEADEIINEAMVLEAMGLGPHPDDEMAGHWEGQRFVPDRVAFRADELPLWRDEA